MFCIGNFRKYVDGWGILWFQNGNSRWRTVAMTLNCNSDLQKRILRSIVDWGCVSWYWSEACASCPAEAWPWRTDRIDRWCPWRPGRRLGWSSKWASTDQSCSRGWTECGRAYLTRRLPTSRRRRRPLRRRFPVRCRCHCNPPPSAETDADWTQFHCRFRCHLRPSQNGRLSGKKTKR